MINSFILSNKKNQPIAKYLVQASCWELRHQRKYPTLGKHSLVQKEDPQT